MATLGAARPSRSTPCLRVHLSFTTVRSLGVALADNADFWHLTVSEAIRQMQREMRNTERLKQCIHGIGKYARLPFATVIFDLLGRLSEQMSRMI